MRLLTVPSAAGDEEDSGEHASTTGHMQPPDQGSGAGTASPPLFGRQTSPFLRPPSATETASSSHANLSHHLYNEEMKLDHRPSQDSNIDNASQPASEKAQELNICDTIEGKKRAKHCNNIAYTNFIKKRAELAVGSKSTLQQSANARPNEELSAVAQEKLPEQTAPNIDLPDSWDEDLVNFEPQLFDIEGPQRPCYCLCHTPPQPMFSKLLDISLHL